MSKAKIKADYIAKLQATYPFYIEGSRALALANEAADNALAGKIKLDGACWLEALHENNVQKAASMKMLAALPE